MTGIARCAVAADGERIHCYVAGTLAGRELEEFEVHLLGCSECEASVRQGAALASALRTARPSRRPTPGSRGRGIWWGSLATATAAAVLVMASRESAIARLGRVAVAPALAGVSVRGHVDSASLLADRGMASYRAGRYAEASRSLAEALHHEENPSVIFYLGVARLLARDPAGAKSWLGTVREDSPYAPDAHFYLAKTWLRLERPDSALAQLIAVSPDAQIAGHAAALADSVKAIWRQPHR